MAEAPNWRSAQTGYPEGVPVLFRAHVVRAVLQSLESWTAYPMVRQIMAEFSGLSVYVAGGVVRDAILGINTPKDFDLFVGGPHFDRFVEGLKKDGRVELGPFGSPRWHPSAGGAYADVISIERFENGVGRCASINDVLKQFDFTANAVAVDLRNNGLHDPVEGIADCCARVMRTVRFDYPEEPIGPGERLSRVQVLWIRLAHYARTLGLDPDPVTRKWLARNAGAARAASLFAERFFPPSLDLTADVF